MTSDKLSVSIHKPDWAIGLLGSRNNHQLNQRIILIILPSAPKRRLPKCASSTASSSARQRERG